MKPEFKEYERKVPQYVELLRWDGKENEIVEIIPPSAKYMQNISHCITCGRLLKDTTHGLVKHIIADGKILQERVCEGDFIINMMPSGYSRFKDNLKDFKLVISHR